MSCSLQATSVAAKEAFHRWRVWRLLFSEPWILLAGWTHYLAFDLLVGNWEMRDATTRGLPYWLVLPCLVLTFLFGPAGWLLYAIVRLSRRAVARSSVVVES